MRDVCGVLGGGLSAVQGLRDDPLWVQWRHVGGQTQLGNRFRESVQQVLMPRSLECVSRHVGAHSCVSFEGFGW